MDYKSRQIAEVMIQRGILPREGEFEITDELLEVSFVMYREIFPPKNSSRKISKGEKNLAKKIAYLNFSSLLQERASTEQSRKIKSKVKSGFVYIISNPVYKNVVKIGCTTNLKKRLSQYQTADPFRKFKVEKYKVVDDMQAEENRILNLARIDIAKGEWVCRDKAFECF